MRITVFTSTFNRIDKLTVLYKSLLNVNFKDFEWIIIDDGSTDDTQRVVNEWLQRKTPFNITYVKKENGGKHRAINLGVQMAKGDLFYIVDSDDWLPPEALSRIDYFEKSINPEIKSNFAGVCGLRGTDSHTPIGTTFDTGVFVDITYLQRKEYKISGDKAEVFYTKVLKQYNFPEFVNENFLTEAYIWNEIALDGLKMRYFNEIIYIGNYLNDGLTKNYWDVYKRNPQGYGLFINQLVKLKQIRFYSKWEAYSLFYKLNKNAISKRQIIEYLKCSSISLNSSLFLYRIFKFYGSKRR